MANDPDFSVEDDKETEETISAEASSEFKRYIERLKKEAKEQALKDVKSN